MLKKVNQKINYLLILSIFLLSITSIVLNKKHWDFFTIEKDLEIELKLISSKYRENISDYSEQLSGMEIKKIATKELGMIDNENDKIIRVEKW